MKNITYALLTAAVAYIAVGAVFGGSLLPYGHLFFDCALGDSCTLREYVIVPIVFTIIVVSWIRATRKRFGKPKE